MALDVAERLRRALAARNGVTEKRMFGGVCFLLREHMLCAGSRRGFMFRVGKAGSREALARPGARPMEMNGRTFEGFVRVDPAQCDTRSLGRWLRLAERYVGALPPKSRKK